MNYLVLVVEVLTLIIAFSITLVNFYNKIQLKRLRRKYKSENDLSKRGEENRREGHFDRDGRIEEPKPYSAVHEQFTARQLLSSSETTASGEDAGSSGTDSREPREVSDTSREASRASRIRGRLFKRK